MMKKINFVLVLLSCLYTINGQNISLMTYNIRLDLASDGENTWPHRKERIVHQLKTNQPDIFGTQEGLPHQIEYINQQLTEYGSIGVPRDDGKTKGEHSNIYYDTSRFFVLENSTFWLSKTPDKPSIGWDSEYPRICTYGLFEEKNLKKKIWVFNTHLDHKGTKARCKSLKLISKTIEEVNPEKHPVVLMGDFNLTADSKEIKKLSRQFKDTYHTNPSPNNTTYNGFNKKHGSRIDYIFVSENIGIHRYSILVEKDDEGRFPSDHFPVVAEICLKEESDYQLVWADEFDNDGLPDTTKWRYDTEGNVAGWGNNEAQFYTKACVENACIDSGLLHITALRKHHQTKEFTSARLISNAEWQYGKIEVNARLPEATGTWAAIWMMPGGWSFNDGNWPDVGEIDIMEHVGHDEGIIHASAHSRDYQWQTGTQKTGTIDIPEATSSFHSYILEWTPEVIKAFVDDSLYFEYSNEGLGTSKWPYEKPFYLILNVAVGGTWGSLNGIDKEAFPQTMEVDYVRIFQRK